jgi:hypothetical protein
MSRGQENQVFDTSQQQNQQFNQNAQQSYQNAQGDVKNYQDQLAQYAAANPYKQGGEFQTSENRVLANTSDAAAQAAGQAMQSQAVRTGQDAGASIAGTEAAEQANERNLGGQEAAANAQRIGSEAGYNQSVLGATAVPAQLETTLSGQQGSLGNEALGTEQKAGEEPSFLDTLGTGFGAAFGKGLGGIAAGGIQGALGCWIAARLWGGWADRRTILVRLWIRMELRRGRRGRALAWFYLRHGRWVAERLMPRSALASWALEKVFNAALARAEAWLATAAGAACWEDYHRHCENWRGLIGEPVPDERVIGVLAMGQMEEVR